MAGSGHCDFLEANVKVFLLVFYAESSLEYSDGKRGDIFGAWTCLTVIDQGTTRQYFNVSFSMLNLS